MKQLYMMFILIGSMFINDSDDTFKRATDLCNTYKISISFYNSPADYKSAFYDSEADMIYLNTGHGFWVDAVKHHKMERAINHYSTDHKDHTILHEIGHSLLMRRIGNRKFSYHANSHTPVSLPRQKMMEVSQYSTTDIIEFFSEVFVGVKTGKNYSKEIMNEYDRIWNL